MDESKIVTIKTFNSATEAVIVQGLLESAGISASLIHETIQSILPLQSGMTQIELVVAEEDEMKARDIIAAKFDNKEFEEASKPTKPKRSCACMRKK